MIRRFLAVALIALAAIVATPVAAHAATTCGAYGLTQSANRAAPGAKVTVTTCFNEPPGTAVTITITGRGVSDSSIIAKPATLDPTGSVSFVVQLPTLALNGDVYTVTVTTANGGSYSARIVAVRADPAASGLAFTGAQVAPYLWVAGALLIVGVGLIVVLQFRRRRARF